MRNFFSRAILSCLFLSTLALTAIAQQPLQNLALNKTATQSSQFESYPASAICDGKGSTINHTNKGINEYVQIDLGQEYLIASVLVLNRNGVRERLKNFDIDLSSSPSRGFQLFANYKDERDKGGWGEFISGTFSSKEAMHGRYVRLTNRDNNYLHIAEIEVYGVPYQDANRMAQIDEGIRQEISATAQEETLNLEQSLFSNIVINNTERTGETKQVNLINKTQEPLDIYINGEKSELKLKGIDGKQSFTFKVGDQVETEGVNTSGEIIGTPTLRISADTKETIFLLAQKSFESISPDARKALTKDHAENLGGIDLLEFDPAFVSNSFKPNGKIFKAINKFNYKTQVETGGAGFYVPQGFGNLGDSNTGRGNFTRQTIIGRDKLQESWSVGASGSVAIPKKTVTVTPNLGFNYKDSKMKQTDRNDVFVSSLERSESYNLALLDVTKTYLTQEFINAIEEIKNTSDANEVIRKYGTHFTDNVIYGSIRQEYVRLQEDKILKSHTRGFDLNGGVKVSKSGTKTITRSPFGRGGTTQVTGSTGSSTLGEAKFSAGWERTDEHYRETSDLTERYAYVGTPDGPVAIAIGNLIPISSLVYPQIMKTEKCESQLQPIRDTLEQAINNHLNSMTEREVNIPYRTFSFKVDNVEWDMADPPLGANIDGYIKAVINLGSLHQEVGISKGDENYQQQFHMEELLKSDAHLHRDDCVDKSKWFVVKQYGYYNGFGGNAEAVFDPITMEVLSSHLLEHDPIGGHDWLKVVPSVFNIEDAAGMQTHTFILEHPWDGTERAKMKINIKLVTGVGFGDNKIHVPGM